MSKGVWIIIGFLVFLLSCTSSNEGKVVVIQPLGQVEEELTNAIARAVKEEYGFRVYLAPARRLPASAFINVKSPRYRADSLIAILRREKPDSANYVLGITQKDISTTKHDKMGGVKQPSWKYEDWGVMGLGYRPGESCVVSTFRLSTKDKKLLKERVCKVSLHELGHNMGLKHCPNKGCVMEDAAETIKTIDRVDMQLCDRCRSRAGL